MATTDARRRLPARRHKDHILKRVCDNRVTIIIGETGSGKSTQVPQMLVEHGLSPVLCTQPRRLAVVAVAKLVAEEMHCELGTAVGYRIGQMNKSSESSKLVFQTAGVLLEELKAKGAKALSKYKVVILDEVHERSVESDMVLCCLKLLLSKNKNMRVVLMSATADFKRYEDYFSGLGPEESVCKIGIPSVQTFLTKQLFQCRVHYLEKVVDLLGQKEEHVNLLRSISQSPSPFVKGTCIGVELQRLISELVFHIHFSEPDVGKSILVFLPTYRALEEQWSFLHCSNAELELYVLHSSIDIDLSLEAMEACSSGKRKVILATDVAESSLTIPGTSFIIDSCMCLEIYWRNDTRVETARLVWESVSQADQRKGRTGRTCNGTVYRLVPRHVYSGFSKFELPAMQLLSLRKQVLYLTCASSRSLNDPMAFLQKCLNPPIAETVQNALEALVSLNALQRDFKSKFHPTFYGRLLAALPLSLDASMLVVEGAERRLLYECAVLAAVADASPTPIAQPFGSTLDHTSKYFQKEEIGQRASRSSNLIGNLCSFEFWQRMFMDKLRWDRLTGEDTSGYRELERQWAEHHHLSPSSLHLVNETVSSVLEVMHRFRPESMNYISGLPSYFKARAFDHSCNVTYDTCAAYPYVRSASLHPAAVEKRIEALILEVRSRYNQINASDYFASDGEEGAPPPCAYFWNGFCRNGENCQFAHSVASRPSICKFYQSGQCRYGERCIFVHAASSPLGTAKLGQQKCKFEDVCANVRGPVLLIGDSILSDLSEIRQCIDSVHPVWAGCIESRDNLLVSDPSLLSTIEALNVQVAWNFWLAALKRSRAAELQPEVVELLKSVGLQYIMFNFPLDDVEETVDDRTYIREFLELISLIRISQGRDGLVLLLTMSSLDFAQAQVERAARDCFFFLEMSVPVDPSFFGDVDLGDEGRFPPNNLVTYFFRLQFPLGRR